MNQRGRTGGFSLLPSLILLLSESSVPRGLLARFREHTAEWVSYFEIPWSSNGPDVHNWITL